MLLFKSGELIHGNVSAGCKYTCHTACRDRVRLDCHPEASPVSQDQLNNNTLLHVSTHYSLCVWSVCTCRQQQQQLFMWSSQLLFPHRDLCSSSNLHSFNRTEYFSRSCWMENRLLSFISDLGNSNSISKQGKKDSYTHIIVDLSLNLNTNIFDES